MATRWWRRRLSLLALLIFGLTAVGCGEATVTRNQPEDSSGEDDEPMTGQEWVDQQDTIVVPWAHAVPEDAVAEATVTEDSVTFPIDGNEDLLDYEPMDIIGSGVTDKPFLRRIIGIETRDAEIVFETRDATLTEAIYKGRITTDDTATQSNELRPEGASPDEFETREQPAKDIDPWDYTPDYPIDIPVSGDAAGGADLDLDIKPIFEVDPNFHLDIEISDQGGDYDPSTADQQSSLDLGDPYFYGSHQCTRDSDCFRGGWSTKFNDDDQQAHEECSSETYGYNGELGRFCRLPFEKNRILAEISVLTLPQNRVEPEYDRRRSLKTCDDIIAAIERSNESQACRDYKESWYQDPSLPRVNERHCGDVLLPYPAHVDWAKEMCEGDLQKFEVDFGLDTKLGVEDVTATASAATRAELKAELITDNLQKRWSKPFLFLPGGFPVVVIAKPAVTFEAQIAFESSLSVTLFDEISYSKNFGAGFHYYDSNYAGSKPYADAGEAAGQWHGHNSGDQGTPVVEESGEVNASASVSATVGLAPRLEVLLYDMAGPYLEPLTLYAGYDAVDNNQDNLDCNYGLKAGIRGEVGLTVGMPFCSACALSWGAELYDTCRVDEAHDGEFYQDDNDDPERLCGIGDWSMASCCSSASASHIECDETPTSDATPAFMQRTYCDSPTSLCLSRCIAGDCAPSTCQQAMDSDDGACETTNNWLELSVASADSPTGEPRATNPDGVDIQDIWVQTSRGVMNPTSISSGQPAEVLAQDSDTFATLNEELAGDSNTDDQYCQNTDPPESAWEEVGLSFTDTVYVEFPRDISAEDTVQFVRTDYGFCTSGGTPSVRVGNRDADSWGAAMTPANWSGSDAPSATVRLPSQCTNSADLCLP